MTSETARLPTWRPSVHGAAMALTDFRLKINRAVGRFPASWRTRLEDALGSKRNWPDLERWASQVFTLTEAERGGLRPDASDGEVCQQADVTARDFRRRIDMLRRLMHQGASYAWMRARWGVRAVPLMLAGFCRKLLEERGLAEVWRWTGARQSEAGVARMCCPHFWRRVYRRLLARTVEATAVRLGLVRRSTGIYCSDDALKRSQAQDKRNAAVLGDVVAVNDHLQTYKLAELAATGVANQEIRRHELLTRIAGFELIAKDCGHIAYMVTVTCPSRFHAAKMAANGRTVDNGKFDGSTPREGQEYLCKQWARLRSAATAGKRGELGRQWYGFRIAEPQHDGTPHWHLLLFMPHEVVNKKGGAMSSAAVMRSLFLGYFLENDSPTERGAAEYRVDFEEIDWSKGSAVGYVIKYVSKNIDGHGVELDLYGEPAITSSQRVRAWARTWGVRQFQQVGGAPVGVWRELRRVHPDNVPETAPEPLRECISAMNVAKVEPGVQSLAWAKYTRAQGGTGVCRKALRVKLVKEAQQGQTRYGEERPEKPVGVMAWETVLFRNHIHEMSPSAAPFERRETMEVESERARWVIGHRIDAMAMAVAAQVFQRSGEAAPPRIHVNNCTAALMAPPRSEFLPVVRRRKKLRRFGWGPRETAEQAMGDPA